MIVNSNGTGGGLSNAGASWAGGVIPVEGDQVNVLNGDTITVTGTHIWGDDTVNAVNVNVGGILKASRVANSTLTVKGDLTILGTTASLFGTFDYGTSVDPIPVAIKATLIMNYSAVMATNKYQFKSTGYGKVYMFGAERTRNTQLDGAVTAGATSAVFDDITGWEAGDIVFLSSTQTGAGYLRADERTILTVDIPNNTVTFAALTYDHADRCYSSNLSSNVTVTSYNTTNPQKFFYLRVLGNAGSQEVQNVAFFYCGLYIETGGGTVATLTAFKNVAISKGYNITFQPHSWRQDDFWFEDLAIISNWTSVATSIYISNGSQAKIRRANVLYVSGGGAVTGAFGFGAKGAVLEDVVFLSGQAGYITGDQTLTQYTRCKFGAGATSSYVLQNTGGSTTFTNCDIGIGDGLSLVPSLNLSTSGYLSTKSFKDCNINVTNIQNSIPNLILANENDKLIIANKNYDPLLQEIWYPGGYLIRDNTVFKTGVASLKYVANTSATKAVNVEFSIFAPTDLPITVSGYLRKNSSYGSSNRPYVTLSGLGITPSTYTLTDVNDTWEQFTVSGTQTTGTDGILTLTVTFQSGVSGGNAWVDGISAPTPVAVNSGDFGYWTGGQPVGLLTANFVSPSDVWNVQKTEATLANSMGELANNIKNDTGLIPATL